MGTGMGMRREMNRVYLSMMEVEIGLYLQLPQRPFWPPQLRGFFISDGYSTGSWVQI